MGAETRMLTLIGLNYSKLFIRHFFQSYRSFVKRDPDLVPHWEKPSGSLKKWMRIHPQPWIFGLKDNFCVPIFETNKSFSISGIPLRTFPSSISSTWFLWQALTDSLGKRETFLNHFIRLSRQKTTTAQKIKHKLFLFVLLLSFVWIV